MARKEDPTATESVAARPIDLRAARALLVCTQGGRTFVVELKEGESVVFGRDPGANGIVLDQKTASRKHARIALVGGALVVEDLKSRNGTWLGERLLKGESASARGGASVRVGELEAIVGTVSARTSASEPFVLADGAMEGVMTLARKVARSDATVLVLGETGVGKEVLATHLHGWSPRSKGPLVRVHCAAIPEALLESQLFGHEKGAFTGADRRTDGFVHAAHRGTLFIDEIGELSASAQVKLLRVLETRSVTRVGSTHETAIDVRFVCATHRDLKKEVDAGRFRADLYYRVASFVLTIPPLRDRRAEIPLLAETFAKPGTAISQRALEALLSYRWPGNVRELRNAIEHAMVLTEGTIELEHLPEAVRAPQGTKQGFFGELEDVEKQRIMAALEAHGGNQTKAAAALGMSRRALVYRLARWRRR